MFEKASSEKLGLATKAHEHPPIYEVTDTTEVSADKLDSIIEIPPAGPNEYHSQIAMTRLSRMYKKRRRSG